MKTKTFFLTTACMAMLFFMKAQNGVGINTDTPRSTLHVNGTFRVDSIKPIPDPTKIAVFTDTNTLNYINTDTLTQKIANEVSRKNIPVMIPWNKNTYFGSGGGYPFTNYYRDNDSVLVANQRPNSAVLWVFIKNRNPQYRNVASDFGATISSDLQLGSAVVIGGYLYLLGVNSSGVRKLNRYNLSNISLGPTAITFSGTKVLTNSSGEIAMSCDGEYFYFSHECGINITTDNVITKHSLSGTTLSYVSTTTLIGATGNVAALIVHPIKWYVVKKPSQPIKNFNLDGTWRGFSNNFAGNFFMNDRGNLYTGMTTESFYEIFYLE